MNAYSHRIVIVEDHPMFRERLAQLINGEPDLELTGETDNAADAVMTIRKAAADLAIIDLSLKDSSGLTLIKALRALGITVPVLVLSMHDESLYAERVIRAGANGYITKQHSTSEVLRAIRTVLVGKVYLSEQAIADFDESREVLVKTVPGQAFSRLSDREIEVLRMISDGKTTREIAAELQVGVASIDTYRARIKDKLGLRNGIELQRFALRCFSEGT